MSETSFLELTGVKRTAWVSEMQPGLSFAEHIAIGFFVYVTLAGWALHLGTRELAFMVVLNAATIATLTMLRHHRRRARWLTAAVDLFPALLLLVAYRESGLLLTPDSTRHLDTVFIAWDRMLLHNSLVEATLKFGSPWLQHYLEFAYLFCYPLVPLGVAAIHIATREKAPGRLPTDRSERAMNDFWSVVLLATLFSYAVYPFFPLTPPRVLFGDVPGPHVEPLLRKWNFWLLDHYSVQACLFPSGHVAAVTAVALAVRKHAPRLGVLFLFAAASVAVATVYGRYHYTADALAGALVGAVAYKLADFLKCRRQEPGVRS